MRTVKIFTIISALAALMPARAAAQRLVEIGQVVVTGTRTPHPLGSQPVLTTLVTAREIERAGSTSLTEVMQNTLPGIVFTPDAMGNNMRIRGLNSRYVLILVDGERLAAEGAGGNVNLDRVAVADIERIEIVGGAASALYGSNAVGAVINIITKQPSDRFAAGAGASFQSHNTLRLGASAAGRTGKTSARASVLSNSSDGFGKVGGVPYAARYADRGAGLRVGHSLSARVDIGVAGRWFSHETFNPEGMLNTTHPLTHSLAATAEGTVRSRDGRNTLRLSAATDNYFGFDVLERRDGQLRRENRVGLATLRAVDHHRFGKRAEVVAGVELGREEVFAKTTLGDRPTTRSLADGALFAQAEVAIFDDLDLVAGARYTRNSNFGGAFSPSLAAMWRVGDLRLRGGVGSAFRAPDIKELYYDFDHQGAFWIYGNPRLRAEKGLYTSLSAEWSRDRFSASAAVYDNRIRNKITQYEAVGAEGRRELHYGNVSGATLRGVDVNLAWIFARRFTLRTAYGFCDATDDATGRQLESNVRHSATVALTWNVGGGTLQVGGRVHSPFTYMTLTEGFKKSGTYSVWRAAASRPIDIGRHTVELTARVENIFGFADPSFADPGRQYMIGLKYKFG
jgi:outer membrane receptor for ferrienterochelin and colicins